MWRCAQVIGELTMQDASDQNAYGYLTQPEVRFLEAAVARLIPADDLGPGAKEAGVACYIDGQLVSSWGTHGRQYRMGPWQDGTPQQGFQSRLTPQEIYRAAIRETDLHCSRHYGRAFCFLAAAQQDEVLRGLEAGGIELESLASRLFFELLLRNTVEGFFADPMYGGNRDKIGWKLVGFPGVASGAYAERLGNHEPYHAEPVSIVDVREQRVAVDSQGYPRHVMRSKPGAEKQR
jgi:gluconate 2-dehydrogenase gamma chain